VYSPRRPASARGAYASSRTLGAGCGGRFGDARRAALQADGEVVWSWRSEAGAKAAESFADDGGNQAMVTGESAEYAVKTIAQGRPEAAPPVVTTVCLLPMHTGRGCELAPGLPCALLFRGWLTQTSDASRRENAKPYLTHSNAPNQPLSSSANADDPVFQRRR
jgi:hypothetical protein